jgi:hypothetical protein
MLITGRPIFVRWRHCTGRVELSAMNSGELWGCRQVRTDGDAETDSANKEQFDKQALPLIAF